MNKNLHHIDDLFHSKLDAYEETPSAGVKESLDAALDKRNVEFDKKKLIRKKTMLLLLLLLTGLVLYESGILKKSTDIAGEKTADKETNYPSGDKHKKTNQIINITDDPIKSNVDNTNKTPAGDDAMLIHPKQKEITASVTTGINTDPGFNKNFPGNKIAVQKNYPEKEKSNLFIVTEKKGTPGIPSISDKNINSILKRTEPFSREKYDELSSPREISIEKMTAGLTTSIKQFTDSLLKNSIAKNTNEKKIKRFKPFWMLTAFASYEQAGYRLDSDFPNNITNIKHSEVHEPSFSLGILATRQLKKQWGLQTGVIYSLIEIGIIPQKLYALQNPGGDIFFKYITSSGYAYIKPGLGTPPAIGDSLITKEGKHSLKFINIPLVIKYSVGNNKLSFTPGVGLEANFLTSAKVETEVESPSNPEIIFINKLDGAKTFSLSIVADAEIRYKLNNKLSVSFRPAIRFAASTITKNNIVETFPRSVGFGTGLSWKF
jgi:hypothetical protein